MLGARSTAADAVGDRNLSHRRFFITGANTGIGFETARALYNGGGIVTLACRDGDKMEAAKARLEEQAPGTPDFNGKVETVVCDLGSQASVKNCVAQFLELQDESGAPLMIDTLICNAGVMDIPYSETEDGFESTFAINHLGHFTLTLLLLPRITRRTVHVSSMAHSNMAPPRMDPQNLHLKDSEYDGFKAYGLSKLAIVLFAKWLNRLLQQSGSEVESYSLHPGVIITELGRYSERTAQTLKRVARKNAEQGAATTVFCALDELAKGQGGNYFSDCSRSVPSRQGKNQGLARRLFEACEKLTGVNFSETV